MPDTIGILMLGTFGLITFGTPVVGAVSLFWRTRAWKFGACFTIVAYAAAVTTLVVLGREPDSGPLAAAIILLMLAASAMTMVLVCLGLLLTRRSVTQSRR
jgi:hypothetical protein